MHQWLVEHIANALEHTAPAERRALDATDPELQLDNERIAELCLFGRSFQVVERLEIFAIDSRRGRDLQQPKTPDGED